MHRASLRVALPVLALAVAVPAIAPAAATGSTSRAAHAGSAHRAAAKVRTLDFHVTVPNEAPGGSGTQSCLIVGDLYKPAGASAHHRVPVIMTTNGFGGSKDDQASLALIAARHGYGVLSYSGLGFGGSGCKISLDDPSYDGRAGKQLVSFLGGKRGIATTTSGKPVKPVNWIVHDRRNHVGHHSAHDPRVGMIGGSYGGEIQFAVADRDPRLDAIIPIITWNDLSYSLAPNNVPAAHGVTYPTDEPGVEKLDWVTLFFGLGIADGLSGTQVDPSRNVGCPNFLTEACVAKAELDSNLVESKDLFQFARHASVESYIRHIHIPTLLAQGQGDTLFNLQEAAATYRSLRAQHRPVRMIWQSWGHSTGTAQPGEWVQGPGLFQTYEGRRFFGWFDHYLKGKPGGLGPRFAYYRDWVHYSGHGPDTAQYATASRFPVGHIKRFYATGGAGLTATRASVTSGSATYSNLGAGAPTSYSETSALDQSNPVTDAPGTFAAFSTSPLRHRLDVAGLPSATLRLDAPTASAAAGPTLLQLFVKVYDVAPNGDVTLVHRLIAPVRTNRPPHSVHVALPGIVHRFPKGHRIELVVAASDAAYRNATVVQPVTVSTSRNQPTVLRLPVVK